MYYHRFKHNCRTRYLRPERSTNKLLQGLKLPAQTLTNFCNMGRTWTTRKLSANLNCLDGIPVDYYISFVHNFSLPPLKEKDLPSNPLNAIIINCYLLPNSRKIYWCLVFELRRVTPCKNLVYPSKLSFPSPLIHSLRIEWAVGPTFSSCIRSMTKSNKWTKLKNNHEYKEDSGQRISSLKYIYIYIPVLVPLLRLPGYPPVQNAQML